MKQVHICGEKSICLKNSVRKDFCLDFFFGEISFLATTIIGKNVSFLEKISFVIFVNL